MVTADRLMARPLIHVNAKPRGLPGEIGDQQARHALASAWHSFVALGPPGAAGKIWQRLGNLRVSRRVPPA